MASAVVARTPEDLPHRALKPEYQRLLEEGLDECYGASSSLILHMIWRGWSLSHVMNALLDAGNHASDRYLRLPRHASRRRIQKDFKYARDRVAAELARRHVPPRQVAAYLERCRQRIEGRTRLTDVAVLEVLVAHCGSGRAEGTISSRTIALQTGRSSATVQRALQRLAAQHGVIALDTSDEGTWYRFLLNSTDEAVTCSPSGVQVTASLQEALPSSRHPLFDPAGLGPSAGLVYAAAIGRKVRQIAEEVRLSESRVYALVATLRDHGLLFSVEGGVWFAVEVDLDDVARHLGVYDTKARRAARIQRERQQWARYKDTEAAKTTKDRRRAMDWQRQNLDDLERTRRMLPPVRPWVDTTALIDDWVRRAKAKPASSLEPGRPEVGGAVLDAAPGA